MNVHGSADICADMHRGVCLVGLLIKWVITQVGAVIFAMILICFSLLFLLLGGNKDE